MTFLIKIWLWYQEEVEDVVVNFFDDILVQKSTYLKTFWQKKNFQATTK